MSRIVSIDRASSQRSVSNEVLNNYILVNTATVVVVAKAIVIILLIMTTRTLETTRHTVLYLPHASHCFYHSAYINSLNPPHPMR